MRIEIEEGKELELDFYKLKKAVNICGAIIPVAVQDIDSNEVILLAYVNEIALEKSIETRTAIFWSTTRNELWEKGKSSGNTFDLREVLVNCEQNSLLFKVRARKGKICHTVNKDDKARNCYYRKLNFTNMELENMDP